MASLTVPRAGRTAAGNRSSPAELLLEPERFLLGAVLHAGEAPDVGYSEYAMTTLAEPRAMVGGYHGRLLEVDLAARTGTPGPLEPGWCRPWIGGSGLAVRLLHTRTRAGEGPGPLVVAGCPLVDSGVTTTAKAALAFPSPLTGLLGESLLSSHWALALKRSGWDALVLSGVCRELSVLLVDEQGARLITGGELRGLPAAETEARLRGQLGTHWQVAATGPAGENGVRFATISHAGRHAGRTGAGAVLGALGLKAICLSGKRRLRPAEPAVLERLAEELRRRSRGSETAKYRLTGTAANMLTFQRLGVLPARNYQETGYSAAERLTGETLATGLVERGGCAACTIGCEHRFRPSGGESAVRAEYESLYALGPLLGVQEPEAVLRAAAACDRYGLDTLSFGGTVAWAMECVERGILSAGDLDGLEVRFGNGEMLPELARRVAFREGHLGELLAEGTRAAARRLGRGSAAWAMHVKGLELPGYEPRALKSLALGLAVGARGACHNRSGAYEQDFAAGVGNAASPAERARVAVRAEDRAAVMDALAVCKFLRHCFADFEAEAAALLAAVTGWDVTGEELRQAGARIVTMKRVYNQECGASRGDDTLPQRLLAEPVRTGAAAGASLPSSEFEALLDAYYVLRRWTPAGTVPPDVVTAVLAGE